jgi:hypothetical protein
MNTAFRRALVMFTATLVCGGAPCVAWAQDEPTTPGAIPQPWTYQGSMELQQQEQQQPQEQAQPQYDAQPQYQAPSYSQPSSGGAAAPAGGRAVARATAPAAPTLRYNYEYSCNSEHIVVGHCRSDSDMPGYAPTTPQDDYCQLYYPDRPRRNDIEAMGVVLRSEVMKTLRDCGAFGPTGAGSNRQPNASANSTKLLSTGPAAGAGVQHASAGSGPRASAQLTVAAGVSVPPGGYLPAAGANVFVTTRSADVALAGAGFAAAPGGTPVNAWIRASQASPDAFREGVVAMTANPVGVARTDANGRVELPPVPPGHYYVFGFVRLARQPLLWSVPVDLKAGSNTLTLDQQNATRLQ